MKNQLTLPIAIVAAGAIIAIAIYFTFAGTTASLTPETASLGADDHVLGNPAAKVLLITYSDFDCPFCKSFDAIVREAARIYGTGGEVAFVFRNFAITELHPNARMHAIAAECVAKTAGADTYWRFTELLFENQPALPTQYAEYAQKAGALPEAIAGCIGSAGENGIGARVDADRENGIRAGARGTPYSLIVTPSAAPVVIEGAVSYAELKDKLDATLAPQQN